MLEFAGFWFAACGDAGLWVLRPGVPPTLLEARPLGGRVTGLVVRGDKLIALTLHTEERVVATGPVSPFSPPAPAVILDLQREPETVAPGTTPLFGATTHGYARRQLATDVEIDLGEDDAIRIGQHILFLDPKRRAVTPGWYGVIAVGVVREVNPHGSHVEVGQNESIEPGSFAQVTTLPRSASTTSPPRTPASFSLSAFARPYLAFNTSGGIGALFDASAALHPRPPLRIDLALSPFGFAETAAQNHIFTFTGYAAISYDSRYWQAGTGVGAQTINSGTRQQPGTGTLFPLLVRLGASDGLNLRLRTDVTLIYQTFRLGSLRAEGRLPLRSGLWLELAGGGGLAGYWLGEAGLRKQFAGNGGSGTSFVTGTLGFMQLFRDVCQPEAPEFALFTNNANCTSGTSPSGMHLGVGIEHRF